MAYEREKPRWETNAPGKVKNVDKINFGWFAVNPGYVVVKKGKITGSVRIKKSGLPHFKGFLSSAERLYVDNRQCDYEAKKYVDKQGIELMIDVAVEFQISNPQQYAKVEKAEDLMKSTIEHLLNGYIQTKTYEELRIVGANNFMIIPEFRIQFAKFETQYGLRVTALKLQNIIIANELVRRQYEDAASQSRENKAIRMRSKAVASANDSFANSMAKTIVSIQKTFEKAGIKDVPTEKIIEIMQSAAVINSVNPNVKAHAFLGRGGTSLENSAMIFGEAPAVSPVVPREMTAADYIREACMDGELDIPRRR